MNFYESSFQELKEYFKIDQQQKNPGKELFLIRILKSNLAIVFWV